MSTIDQVIERSRQPGAFSERKRFTVARSRAIQKMRKFALADPHFYILELIQGAVANGATYIDIVSQKRFAALSYVGGGFAQNELSQLFDFLFASKTDVAHGDLRQMALGVNALMLMEPEEIVIESGDGTLAGTTRILIRGGDDTVEVGTPNQPLRGTYFRASGLKRSKIARSSNLTSNEVGPPECRAIEDRCLTAPVPILVNDQPIFGYSTVRSPTIYGYRNVLTVDEGDLYGTIGHVDGASYNLNLKLLTYGVWIQTLALEETPFGNIGGVLCFDGLNKTADHAAIVRDGRLQELWARLAPYVQRLTSGDTSALEYNVRTMSDQKLAIPEIRELLAESDTVIFLSPEEARDPERVARAQRIGRLVDAAVLSVPDHQVDSVRYLGGPGTRVLQPQLDNDEDVSFYELPRLEPPPRPWLIGAIDARPMTLAEALRGMVFERWGLDALQRGAQGLSRKQDRLVRAWTEGLGGKLVEGTNPAELQSKLGASLTSDDSFERYVATPGFGVQGELRAKIYTPVETVTEVDEMLVRIVSADRLLWAGRIETTFPGHVLEIGLDDVLPRMILAPVEDQEGSPLIAEMLAGAVARHVFDDFGRATRRALEGLSLEDVAPNTGAAHLIMAAVAREAMLRVRTGASGEVGLRHSLLTSYPVDLFELPVLETLSGEPRTLAQVIAGMERCHGLIYGVIPEIAPSLKGLDTTPVLKLSTQEERLLMSIFGPSTYVRLDKRDILASHEDPMCLVRDLALGMKTYPDEVSLLVEFADPHKWTPEQRVAIERALVFKLLNLAYGSSDVEPIPENRRQALRHLQWFLLHSEPGEPTHGLEDIPLFVDSAGRACTHRQLMTTLEVRGALLMSDGRGVDVIALGGLDEGAERSPDTMVDGLAMDPFVFALLRAHHRVHGAFDFDLSEEEAKSAEHTPEAPYLVSREIHDENFEGTIGVPLALLEDYSIAILDPEGHLIHPARGVAYTYGLVGRLRRRSIEISDAKLMGHVPGIMAEVIASLPTYTYDSPEWRAAIHTLLRHAGQGISLTLDPDRQVRVGIYQTLVRQILELPLFDTQANFPVSAMRLLREFCLRVDPGANEPFRDFSTPLVEDLHPLLTGWLKRHLHPRAIARLGVERDGPPVSHARDSQAAPGEADLERTLSHWLETLRPDPVPLHLVRGVDPSRQGRDEYDMWWAEHGPRGRPFAFLVNQGHHTLLFHTQHPLVAWASERMGEDPEALAWLLLASYALINEVLEPVTNDHELTFQLAISEALGRGKLRPV